MEEDIAVETGVEVNVVSGEVKNLAMPISGEIKDFEEFKEFIVGQIKGELDSSSREGQIEKLKKWRRQRMARPEKEIKDYPFPKSTNLAPPLTQSKINTVYGKTLAGFSLKRPFWDCITNNSALKAQAGAFGRLLNAYANDPFSLNLKTVIRPLLYEAESLGFEFYDIIWANENTVVVDDAGVVKKVMTRSGPQIRTYMAEDVVINATWTDIQKAPFVALGFDMSWADILNAVDSGYYDREAVERIKYSPKTSVDDSTKEIQKSVGTDAEPSTSALITSSFKLYRFYSKWLVNNMVMDLVGVVHIDTGEILRLEINKLGWRLVGKIGYFEVPGTIFDIGICHQCEYLQDEVEMLHNYSGDAMKWGMLGMYKALKDSGISSNEQVYPGKIFLLDNMGDLQEMKFQIDIGPALARENMTMRYADMATGANQALSGQADSTLKSGGGSQAQQVLMQASSTIIDAEFDTLDEGMAEMGRLISVLLMRNSRFISLDSLVDADDAALLTEFFRSYTEADIVSQFRFVVRTTDIERSDATKKETLALFSQIYSGHIAETTQMLTQYVQIQAQAAQAGQGMQNPMMAVAEFLKKAINGKNDLMRQMADFMHTGIDIDKYFPKEVISEGGLSGTGEGTNGPMGPETGNG